MKGEEEKTLGLFFSVKSIKIFDKNDKINMVKIDTDLTHMMKKRFKINIFF